jgi:diadenosine tetraphosphate (Ap4A) HIT family hydrolase
MDCIFCKIAAGEIPGFKIWEDSRHIAILDINPNVKGTILVITKQHYPSHIFDMDQDAYSALMGAVREAVAVLRRGLHVDRVGMGMDGTGINHAHVKLFPFHRKIGVELHESEERVYFERFPGYLTTQLGPMKTTDELSAVAEEIRLNLANRKTNEVQ